jgi:hypothetical protein
MYNRTLLLVVVSIRLYVSTVSTHLYVPVVSIHLCVSVVNVHMYVLCSEHSFRCYNRRQSFVIDYLHVCNERVCVCGTQPF